MSAINANNQNSNPSANESPFSVENFIYSSPFDLLFLYKDAYRNANSTTDSSLDRDSNKFIPREKSYMTLTEKLTCNYRFQNTGSNNNPETITCSTENLKDCTANPPSNQQAILDSLQERLSTLSNNLSIFDVRRSLYKLDPVEVECQSIFKTYTNHYIKPDLLNFFTPKLNDVYESLSSIRHYFITQCEFKDGRDGPSIDCESRYRSQNDRTIYEGKFHRLFHGGEHEFKIRTTYDEVPACGKPLHDLWKTALNNCERAKIESYHSCCPDNRPTILRITYKVPVQEEIASHTNFNSIIPVVLGCFTLIGIFYSAYKYCCSSARSKQKKEPKAESSKLKI